MKKQKRKEVVVIEAMDSSSPSGSAKRLAEKSSLSRCPQPQKSVQDVHAAHVHSLTSKQVCESPATGALEAYPSRCLRKVDNPSTLTPEMRHAGTTENFVNPVPLKGLFTVDVQEMEESLPNNSNRMEGPLDLPSAVDLQASNHVEEGGADKNHSKSVSMARSASVSLKLTEMVSMWEDDEGDDEVNSARKHSTVDNDHGYRVKPEYMPMLREVFNKHGDIAENCTVVSTKYRSMMLEMVFDIITELQDSDFGRIREDNLQDMIALVNEMKNIIVDILWLQVRLEEILDARLILKQSGMLREKRENNRKAIENVEKELEECEAEKMAVGAKFRKMCAKEVACKEALARARDEGIRVHETISYAKAKVRRFLNCSLEDGLL